MYDKYMMVEDEFKNVVEEGKVTGFQIGLRMPFYSSLVLSLVGKTNITVDGEHFSSEQMTVTLRGKTYLHSQLEDEPKEKWEFGEVGIVKVSKPGGLQPGEHTVELNQHIRIAFLPEGLSGHDVKVLRLKE